MSGVLFSSEMGTVICNIWLKISTRDLPDVTDWFEECPKWKKKKIELPNSLYLLGKPETKA